MTSLQGQLLVASPHFIGTPLPRAVVLLTDHSEQGASGVMLNHPLNEQLLHQCHQLWQEGKTPALALKMLSITGPTANAPVDKAQEDSVAAANQPPEVITEDHNNPQEILDAGVPSVPADQPPAQIPVGVLVGPTPGGRLKGKLQPAFRVVVGQMGWSNEQLAEQVRQGLWLTTEATPDLIFGLHDDLWQTAVKRVGQTVLTESLGIVPTPLAGLN